MGSSEKPLASEPTAADDALDSEGARPVVVPINESQGEGSSAPAKPEPRTWPASEIAELAREGALEAMQAAEVAYKQAEQRFQERLGKAMKHDDVPREDEPPVRGINLVDGEWIEII